ncbi:Oidioi.mRNA.OKI2018_I69.PAR.g12295.t1.cds [Oikopleura dioica]|uniref:Oidioi.mRNA.OKI2018_I69.PAR.g12295.t1.cds n=1 Tax=Oikopleura dioica TaxID=34765 RepID=A0ABN7RZG4_OIKDI|nr:Oidioi.mRNA.OKI2018_I69.PAR.g12295.t1.cds [Oikopleura dioica]
MRAIDNPDDEIQEPCRRLCFEAFQHLSPADKIRATGEMQKMYQNGLSAKHFRFLICETFDGMRTEGCRKTLMKLLFTDVGVQACKALKSYKAPSERDLNELVINAKDNAIHIMRTIELAANYEETQKFARDTILDAIHLFSRDVLAILKMMGSLPYIIVGTCIPILRDYQKEYEEAGYTMLVYGGFLKLYTRYYVNSGDKLPVCCGDESFFLQTCTLLMTERPEIEDRLRNDTSLMRVIDKNSSVDKMQDLIMDCLRAILDNSLLTQDCFAFWFPVSYAHKLVVNADDPSKKTRERALKTILATAKHNDSLEFYKGVNNFNQIWSGPGFTDIREQICQRFAALPSFEKIYGKEIAKVWRGSIERSIPDPRVATDYDFIC